MNFDSPDFCRLMVVIQLDIGPLCVWFGNKEGRDRLISLLFIHFCGMMTSLFYVWLRGQERKHLDACLVEGFLDACSVFC